jgi:hypothetical protein
LNQDLQQFIGVRFDGLTNLDKFHDVDTPFAAFVFGDEGLRSTKALGSATDRAGLVQSPPTDSNFAGAVDGKKR